MGQASGSKLSHLRLEIASGLITIEVLDLPPVKPLLMLLHMDLLLGLVLAALNIAVEPLDIDAVYVGEMEPERVGRFGLVQAARLRAGEESNSGIRKDVILDLLTLSIGPLYRSYERDIPHRGKGHIGVGPQRHGSPCYDTGPCSFPHWGFDDHL